MALADDADVTVRSTHAKPSGAQLTKHCPQSVLHSLQANPPLLYISVSLPEGVTFMARSHPTCRYFWCSHETPRSYFCPTFPRLPLSCLVNPYCCLPCIYPHFLTRHSCPFSLPRSPSFLVASLDPIPSFSPTYSHSFLPRERLPRLPVHSRSELLPFPPTVAPH